MISYKDLWFFNFFQILRKSWLCVAQVIWRTKKQLSFLISSNTLCTVILALARLEGGFAAALAPTISWPHSNPKFPYCLWGFLTINYEKQYKKQWFLIQCAKFDGFPTSTQKFFKKYFRPFSAVFSQLSYFFDLSILKFVLKRFIFI